MRIISCRTGQKAKFENITNHLYYLQQFVGGHIETVTSPTGFVIICNEEGRIRDLPENPVVDPMTAGMWRWPEVLRGDYLICVLDGDSFADIPDDDLTTDLLKIINSVRCHDDR